MRRGRDAGLLRVDDDRIIGVNLGADHVAEHECGIKEIQAAFGIDDTAVGLDRRIIRAMPAIQSLGDRWGRRYLTRIGSDVAIKFSKGKKSNRVDVAPRGFAYQRHRGDPVDRELSRSGDPALSGAWSGSDFGAMAYEKKEADVLDRVFEAFEKLDIAIWLGGGGPFQNAGLCIAIASQIPQQVTTEWRDADMERIRLRQDVEKLGIEATLKRAGKQWFALSPKREPDGSIKFWLNPEDQSRNHSGWFTVEQLLEWADGKGPVVRDVPRRW